MRWERVGELVKVHDDDWRGRCTTEYAQGDYPLIVTCQEVVSRWIRYQTRGIWSSPPSGRRSGCLDFSTLLTPFHHQQIPWAKSMIFSLCEECNPSHQIGGTYFSHSLILAYFTLCVKNSQTQLLTLTFFELNVRHTLYTVQYTKDN